MFDLGITTDDEVEVALMSELRPAVIKGPLV
jgi:hypothetical protein